MIEFIGLLFIVALLFSSIYTIIITMRVKRWPKGLRVEDIENLILYHNMMYWDFNSPKISPDDYDKLVGRLKKIKPHSRVLMMFDTKRITDRNDIR